ncbi:Clan CA, family C19, ubiquitin hydrolase-like cysteine peptidase [Trichomonas vaginalis G3]|uniref:Clan CA, family C19, ubiquitin hydrolase-like cysteine peptidase n=1 Tax=Trichomonas vaginalis (strain ATCC PRA-98 / G3) TaxID=412133 RepID=A2DYG6_TRIV3|nr:ubiquitinyl hydrolase protein [Trichomonas vaginalis G3]EAY14501.1 Clan CA, family C19, ubiquitin hydrolase-like cysteine peptidase [Trichomonas vaginalis G3]KAI5529326.1 ubiquitinyl hydrolase protein [Trichomonas vaginalis G3]|eukprot:XP_001326724.1 Clan CA, family C19, ubiquitin hydrolase-like cysteine peptidase [Trichomonas vaginalis G3]
MLDPEDNFDSWLALVRDLIDDPDQFEPFYPGFLRLFDCISKTGFLPEEITQEPDIFVKNQFLLTKLLYIEKPSSRQQKLIQKFFTLLLKLSLIGFGYGEQALMSLATTIITITEWPLYNSGRRHLYQQLCSAFIGLGAPNILIEYMCNRCQNFKLFNESLAIYSTIAKFDDNFNFDNVVVRITHSIQKILDLTWNSNGYMELPKALEHFRAILPETKGDADYLLDQLTPILEKFIVQNSFDQRRIFLVVLQQLINDKYLAEPTAFFVKGHPDILKNFQFHTQFGEALGDILTGVAKYGLLEKEIIRKVWSLHSSRYDTEVEPFIKMFVKMAETAKDDTLSEVVGCILSSDNSNKVWFNTVDKLITKVGERPNLTNEVTQIKNTLWTIAFDSNHPCRKNGRESLLNIIGNKPDMATFKAIMTEEQRTDIDSETRIYCYQLMRDIIEFKLKVPPEVFKVVVGRCIEAIFNSRPIPDEFFAFLTNTYKSLRLNFETEFLQQIIRLRKTSDKIYPFINSLCDNDLIETEVMNELIDGIPLSEFDYGFYSFIDHFMGLLNFNQNDVITKLPLQNEELLWRFSLEESPMREKFVDLLCNMYDSNDGNELTDEMMIAEFIKHWSVLECEDTKKLNLLISFISCIEDKIDTEVPPRFPDKFIVKLTCTSTEPEFTVNLDVGSESTIGCVCEKVAKQRDVKVSTILAFSKGNELNRSTKLKDLDSFGDNMSLEIKYRTSKKGKRSHKRNCWPSLYLKQTEYPSQFYLRLKTNGESIIYDILSRLQTVEPSHEILKPMLEGINCQTGAFDENNTYFFLYNLTTFVNYFLDENTKQKATDCTRKFFVDNYFCLIFGNIRKNFLDKSNFRDILFELMRFFRYYQPINEQVFKNMFFELLELGNDIDEKVTLSKMESKIMFNHINQTIEYQFQTKKRILQLDNASKHIFNMLLLPDQRKRNLAKNAFEAISFPLDLFNENLINYMSIITDEFIACLSDHLTDQPNPVTSLHLAEIFFQMIEQNQNNLNMILKTIDKMLMFNLYPEELKPKLTHFLINRFFTYDNDFIRNESFHSAVNCLTKLTDIKENGVNLLHQSLLSHFDGLKPFSSYSSRNDACLISSANRVGLTNLGATCYMNSTLQQIFAIPALRQIIINYKGSDDVLRELSYLFTRLQYSTCKTESAFELTKYYKWWGQPLNLREQQDAVEFIDSLVTNHLMEDKEIGKSVRDICQGQMRYHVDGMDVDYHDTTSTQDYTCLEVEITPETTKLSDCIEKLTRPNYFTDQTSKYNTETIGAINAIRRCFIDKAPPILIVHVKRFDYDHIKQQRIKINTHLEVPLELDISPAAEQDKQYSKYKLNGVVVHRGINALGGHYVSYVQRNEDEMWTLFNDEDVSVVSKDVMFNETNGSDTSVGYILFYVLPEMMEEKTFEPDEKVKSEVDSKNAENRLKTLYFNDNYYDMMMCLSKMTSNDFDDILMSFSVKMLPFSPFCSKCSDFMTYLLPKITPSFVDLLDEDYFKVCTFECPHDSFRKGFCNLLTKSLTDENVDKVFNLSFKLVDILLSDSNHMDDTFHVLHSVLMSSQKSYDSYINQIRDRVSQFLIEDISNYLAANSQMKRQYFFSGLNMSYALKLCATFDAVPSDLMKESFLVDIATSTASQPEAIAEYVKKFFSEDMFLNFIRQHGRIFRPHRLFTLLTTACPEKCMQTFMTMQIQAIKADDLETDRSTAIAICAATEQCTKDAIINHREQWIDRFLFSDNVNVRTNAVAIISHIIGDESLKILSSIYINQEMYIQQPPFKQNDDKEQIHILSNLFCQTLLDLVPQLLKQLRVDVKTKKAQMLENKPIRANEFVELLVELLPLTNTKLPVETISCLLNPINHLSIQCTAAANIIQIFLRCKIIISNEEIIECVKGAKLGAKKSRSVCEFLEYFIPYTYLLPTIPEEVVSYYLQQILFAKPKNIHKIYKMVDELIVYLCKKSPCNSQVLAYIDTKLKVSCQQNLPNVCIALSSLGEKRDIYQYFIDAVDENDVTRTTDEIIDLVLAGHIKNMRRQTLQDALTREREDDK